MLLLISLINGNAQTVSVASMKQNVVTLGTDNPLTIMVENCDCSNLTVTTDNGSIKRYDDCSYDYKPARLGMAQIVVSCKGRKAPTNYLMRVVGSGGTGEGVAASEIGDKPLAIIDKKNGGYIRKVVLAAQLGVGVSSSNKGVHYIMERFTIAAFRGDQILFSKINIGPKFTDDVKSAISNLKLSDRVLFFNMECSAGKNAAVRLSPIEFIIVN